MMKFMAAALVIVIAASCVKDNADMTSEQNDQKVSMTFTASSPQSASTLQQAPALKSVLNGKAVNWQETDKILVFGNSGESQGEFSIVEGSTVADPTIADFTGEITPSAEYHAVYPAAGWTVEDGKYVFSGLAQQTAVAESFDPAMALSMAAATEGNRLLFKNLCALVKVTVGSRAIHKIRISGTVEGGSLGGKLAWTPGELAVSAIETDGPKEIVLADGTSELPMGTSYYIVVPACTINGFTLDLIDTHGYTLGSIKKASAFTPVRNTVYDLGEVKEDRANWTMTCSQNPLPDVTGRNNSLTAMLDGDFNSTFCITRPGKNSGGVNLSTSANPGIDMSKYEIYFVIDIKEAKDINFFRIRHLSVNNKSDRGVRLHKFSEIWGSNTGNEEDFTRIDDGNGVDFLAISQDLTRATTGNIAIPKTSYQFYKFLMRGSECYDPGDVGTDGSSNNGNTAQIKEFYLGYDPALDTVQD